VDRNTEDVVDPDHFDYLPVDEKTTPAEITAVFANPFEEEN
jgi:hypothetical protein